MKKADSSADKTNRIIEQIEKMSPGEVIKPTPLSKKSKVHFTKLLDDMAKVESYKKSDFELIWSSPNKLEFIKKTEPEMLMFKKDILTMKNDINSIKLILEELKNKK